MTSSLSWIEIDTDAIAHNIRQFKKLLPRETKLMAVVKGEAYGHGMVPTALAALRSGADWLGVFNLAEVEELRQEGILAPTLVLGYVPMDDLVEAAELDARITVSSLETIEAASRAAGKSGKKLRLHLKLETGTSRLGLFEDQLREAISALRSPVSTRVLYSNARSHPNLSSRARVGPRNLAIALPLFGPRRIVIASNTGRCRATSSSRVNSSSVRARRFRRQSALASAFGTSANGLPTSRCVRTHQLPNPTNSCRYSL